MIVEKQDIENHKKSA